MSNHSIATRPGGEGLSVCYGELPAEAALGVAEHAVAELAVERVRLEHGRGHRSDLMRLDAAAALATLATARP